AEEAVRRGERRLDARIGALPLERLDQSGLLAADVGARAAMHVDLDVEAGAEDVLPDEPGLPRLGDGLLQHPRAVLELAADVDVGSVAADGPSGDDDALEELMRVLLDDHAVLERAGLAL